MNMMESPKPPASTTPASLRTASISGVRSVVSMAWVAAVSTTSFTLAPCAATLTAASAVSRMTVSIVPSTGLGTAP